MLSYWHYRGEETLVLAALSCFLEVNPDGQLDRGTASIGAVAGSQVNSQEQLPTKPQEEVGAEMSFPRRATASLQGVPTQHLSRSAKKSS